MSPASRPATLYALGCLVWVAVHHVVLPGALWQDVSFVLSTLPPLAVLLVARRSLTGQARRLCVGVVAALTVYTLGNLAYLVQAHLFGSPTFLAPSDAFFLGSTVVLVVALARVSHAVARWTVGGVLDLAVVLLGSGLLFHSLVSAPLVAGSHSVPTLVAVLSYPLLDLLVLLLAARLVTGPRRSPAARALLGCTLLAFVAGSAFAVLAGTGRYSTGDPADLLFVLRNLSLGLVGLLPGLGALGARDDAARHDDPRPGALVLPAGVLGPLPVVAALVAHRPVPGLSAVLMLLLLWTVLARLAHGLRLQDRLLQRSRALEAELGHRVHHDELTGLPNRALLERELVRALTAGDPTSVPGLLYVDLDGFKQVNDNLGHGVGDRLLVKVAGRLRGCARDGDLVCRLAGDEFVLLVPLPRQEARQVAADLAARVRESLRAGLVVDGRPLRVSGSVGVAVARPGEGLEQVLHRADLDMYADKSASRGRPVDSGPLVPPPR